MNGSICRGRDESWVYGALAEDEERIPKVIVVMVFKILVWLMTAVYFCKRSSTRLLLLLNSCQLQEE